MRRHFIIIAILVTLPLAVFIFIASDDPPISVANRPVGFKEAQLADRVSPPARLFIRTCIQCHDLPDPKMHASEEWPLVVSRMFDRLQRRKAFSMESKALFLPSPSELGEIATYLSRHGFKRASPRMIQDASLEAVLFSRKCTQCHQLPDPSQHTANEWAAVIDRMQGHIRERGKQEMTDDEKRTLLSFLSREAR